MAVKEIIVPAGWWRATGGLGEDDGGGLLGGDRRLMRRCAMTSESERCVMHDTRCMTMSPCCVLRDALSRSPKAVVGWRVPWPCAALCRILSLAGKDRKNGNGRPLSRVCICGASSGANGFGRSAGQVAQRDGQVARATQTGGDGLRFMPRCAACCRDER
jgi:hypothetical protein